MIRIALLSLVLLAAWVAAGMAEAHGLRVFAQVEGGRVSGYGFFISGGRAQGVPWVARIQDRQIAAGRTDAEGGFAFAAPTDTEGLTLTLDTGDGHMAVARLGASPASEIEEAVARQIAPLMARIEEMDARLRLADVISGLCLIFGLAGVALWARRR